MCKNTAMYRYTWPGRNESYICEEHAEQLMTVAKVIDLSLQLIILPISSEILCKQQTKDE